MPNWCTNTLTVTGSEESLNKMKDTVVNGPSAFSLEKIVPMPKEIRATTSPQRDEELGRRLLEKYGAVDWYDWAWKNWGTKWDVDAGCDDASDRGVIIYRFESAWAPPNAAIEKLASQYPSLRFELEYDEPGANIWGLDVYQDGELIDSMEGPSRLASSEWGEEEEDLPDED